MAGLRRTSRAKNAAAYGVAGFFLFFGLAPIVWLIITSFKSENEIVNRELTYYPHNPVITNYIDVWNQSSFPTLMMNSFLTTTMTVIMCVVVGTLASYSFSQYRFPGKHALLLFYLVVRMFPAVLMIIPLFLIMRFLGLLDTKFGLALAYTSFLMPLFIWMMKGFFDAVPVELEKAARIDGCTRIGALVRVIMPLVRNGLAATAIFVAIAAWNEYMFALMLTTSSGSRTWPVGLQLMIGEFQLPWGLLAAGGVVSIIPVIILFALVQQTMVRGLTAGAVKG
ncbi:carbohydrate ABC transporter permease [Bauldia sp.]|uniref:carbohydrate ABC transporter permease n=1 Tax=Bauldia sp. TaxID=2575872 RepID=UPI003BAD01A6